ncbi:hypothetical protein JCM3770_003921 [Rhodotorula araucariae]
MRLFAFLFFAATGTTARMSAYASIGIRQPSKVCVPCQRRKVSCDLGRPVCGACRKYGKARPGHTCVYEEGAPLPGDAASRRASSADPAEMLAGRTRAETKALLCGAEPAPTADGVHDKQDDEVGAAACNGPAVPVPQAEDVDEPDAFTDEAIPPVDIPPSLHLPRLPTFPTAAAEPASPALPTTAEFNHALRLEDMIHPSSPRAFDWPATPYSAAYCPTVYHTVDGVGGLNANLSELGLEEYEYAFSSTYSPYHFGPFA